MKDSMAGMEVWSWDPAGCLTQIRYPDGRTLTGEALAAYLGKLRIRSEPKDDGSNEGDGQKPD
jgi:hypothetical protein